MTESKGRFLRGGEDIIIEKEKQILEGKPQ